MQVFGFSIRLVYYMPMIWLMLITLLASNWGCGIFFTPPQVGKEVKPLGNLAVPITDIGPAVNAGISMALDARDKAHIAYFGRSDGSRSRTLYYTTNSRIWESYIIGGVDTRLGGVDIRYEAPTASIAVDASGIPHFVYWDTTALKYVRKNSTQSPREWNREIIKNSRYGYQQASLLVDPGQKAHVVYSSGRELEYALSLIHI